MNAVVFSGGRATQSLIDSLLSLNEVCDSGIQLALIVNAYDNAGSTGLIRERFSVQSPSDLHKAMRLLIDTDSPDGKAASAFFALRFGKEDDGDLGCEEAILQAIAQEDEITLRQSRKGNCFLALMQPFREIVRYGLSEYLKVVAQFDGQTTDYSDFSLISAVFAGLMGIRGSLQRVADKVAASIPLKGRVLLNSEENCYLYCVTETGGRGGAASVLDEEQIVSLRSSARIDKIYLLPSPLADDEIRWITDLSVPETKKELECRSKLPKPSREAIQALEEADMIIYGPGTQHSSLLPTYLTKGLGSTIAQNQQAKKIFVTNIGEDSDIHGYTAGEIVQIAHDVLNRGSSRNYVAEDLFTDILVNCSHHEKPSNIQPNMRFFVNRLDAQLVYSLTEEQASLAAVKGVRVFCLPLEEDGSGKHAKSILHDLLHIILTGKTSWLQTARKRLTSGAIIFDVDETILDVQVAADERFEQTLLEAPVRKTLIDLLRAGFDICAITGNDLEKFKGRFSEHLISGLRATGEEHLIERFEVYGNGAATHLTFECDKVCEVRYVEDANYNQMNLMSDEDYTVVKSVLHSIANTEDLIPSKEKLSQKYDMGKWQYCRDPSNAVWCQRGSDGLEVKIPWVAERGGRAMLTLKPLPSSRHFRIDTPAGEVDLRDQVLERCKEELEMALGERYRKLSVRTGGWSSIDVTCKVSKAGAVHHYCQEHGLSGDDILYFGNEFRPGGNDKSVADGVPGVHVISVNQEEEDTLYESNAFYGGSRGTASTMHHFGDILERVGKGLKTVRRKGPRAVSKLTPVIHEKIHDFYNEKILNLKEALGITPWADRAADCFRRHRAVLSEFQGDLKIAESGPVAMILPAAGNATRLGCLSKALYAIAGKSSVLYPIEGFSPFVSESVVVIRPGDKEVFDKMLRTRSENVHMVLDERAAGDWCSVALGLSRLQSEVDTVLVVWCNLVVVDQERIREILLNHFTSGADVTLPTAFVHNPCNRVLLDDHGNLSPITHTAERGGAGGWLEHDCSFFVFKIKALQHGLNELKKRHSSITHPAVDSVKFTDVVKVLINEGFQVNALNICRTGDFQSFNTPGEAARVSALLHGEEGG